jgi:hypothetical protein
MRAVLKCIFPRGSACIVLYCTVIQYCCVQGERSLQLKTAKRAHRVRGQVAEF